MSTISGIRAVLAVKAALAEAGFRRNSDLNGAQISGWIQPNHYGSTGYSIRPRDDGRLDWHVVISGKPHLKYREWTEHREDEDSIDLHEPINPDSLAPKIKAAVEKLGLKVHTVQHCGHQTHWDDDVDFEIVTDVPTWLDTKDRSNKLRKPAAEYALITCNTGRTGKGPAAVRRLPAYVDRNGCYFLPEESLLAIADAVEQSNAYASDKTTFTLSDGKLIYQKRGDIPVKLAASEIENFWGDKVKVWPVPGYWIEPQAEFKPAFPFLMGGEMRLEAPFAEIDAQNGGDAPWIEQKAPALAP